MALFDRFRKKNLADPTPKTYDSKSFGKTPEFFNDAGKITPKLCRAIYDAGGPVSEGIDAYALFAFANGYTLEGKDEGLVNRVQEELDRLDFESLGHAAIIDSLVCGFGIQEIVSNKGNTQIVKVIPRPSEDFRVNRDRYGNIEGFTQVIEINGVKYESDLPLEDAVYIDLQYPLMRRAYDDILRDTKTADATAQAIQRHGYPRYHVKVGAEGEKVPKSAVDSVGGEFEDLKPGEEISTVRDVDIVPLDADGIANINEYNTWSTTRVSAAIGIPEEIMGLGRGSTEATANVRMKCFLLKVASLQVRLARGFQPVVDRLADGRKGAVKISFNSPDSSEDMTAIEYITKAANAIPGDPYALLTPEQMWDYLGIEGRKEEVQPPAQDQAQTDAGGQT